MTEDTKAKAAAWIAERVGIPTLLLVVVFAGLYMAAGVAWRDVVLPVKDETIATLKSIKTNTNSNTEKLVDHDALLHQIKEDGSERTDILKEIRAEQQRTTQAILDAAGAKAP